VYREGNCLNKIFRNVKEVSEKPRKWRNGWEDISVPGDKKGWEVSH